jgi:ribosomal-protein-alanine N-acetyltransferase
MGLPPERETLALAAGVLVALAGTRVAGVLALCPYSDEQVTLWGPALLRGASETIAVRLLAAAREALQLSRYGSVRALVDTRNRRARALLMTHGFGTWKDDLLFERKVDDAEAAAPTRVRVAGARDHHAVATIFIQSFPDSDHCLPSLGKREQEGFRHYLLEDGDTPVAAAAVHDAGRRAWLKLIAVSPAARGKGHSRALLSGIVTEEAKRRTRLIGLEVLADNAAAIRLYEGGGFKRRWTATVMTGPV